jgi:hypothetical protein
VVDHTTHNSKFEGSNPVAFVLSRDTRSTFYISVINDSLNCRTKTGHTLIKTCLFNRCVVIHEIKQRNIKHALKEFLLNVCKEIGQLFLNVNKTRRHSGGGLARPK